MKRLRRDEKGQALILALILLLIGGLIAAPLLAYMGTGLLTGEVYDRRTAELYAADAGVEDAMWRIQNNRPQNYPYSYPEPLRVNDKSVDVVIDREVIVDTPCYKEYRYRILSTATSTHGSGTRIEAYVNSTVTYMSYAGIMDHLVTIDNKNINVNDLENDLSKIPITCPDGCTNCSVCGNAYDYTSAAYQQLSIECRRCVAVYNYPDGDWPPSGNLSAVYWEHVKDLQPDNRSSITLNGNSIVLGPLKRLGPLTISGTGSVTLNGTLYITGETSITGQTDNKRIVLKLNGQTIFVNCTGQKALEIKQCDLEGPGIIIAVGDITFWPKLTAGVQAPIFVLSVLGTTDVQPSGQFYGAIAGKVDVEVAQGSNPRLTYPVGGFGNLTIPSLVVTSRTYTITSWEVSPL